jgi:hypothetical protein
MIIRARVKGKTGYGSKQLIHIHSAPDRTLPPPSGMTCTTDVKIINTLLD